MSCATTILEIEAAGRTVRARLMTEENPGVVHLVTSHLTLTSFALHTNCSGQGIVLPTTIAYTGTGHMVDRGPGTVYLFAPGQSIVITYGKTNETAPVNKFAQVFEEDMPELIAMGKAVYDDTLVAAQHKVLGANVRPRSFENGNVSTQSNKVLGATVRAPSFGNGNGSTQSNKVLGATIHARSLENGNGSTQSNKVVDDDLLARQVGSLKQQILQFDGGWKSAEAIFLAEAIRALEAEPEEIFTSFSGIIPSGMGTGGNALAVWMHKWSDLMTLGPNVLYGFLTDAQIPGMTLTIMVNITRNHLLRPFNHFQFLGDLGVTRFKVWGGMYADALDQLESLEEYKKLTSAMLTLVNLYLRRVQSRFPFYLGKSFPRISREEILRLASTCSC